MSGSRVDDDVSMFTEGLVEEPKKSSRKIPKEKEEAFSSNPKLQDFVPAAPEEDETDAKAVIWRKITSYAKEFPERLEGVKMGTKQSFAKMTLVEAKMLLLDVEHELGKSGAYEYVKQAYVWSSEALEKFQAKSKALPFDLTHFGKMAHVSVSTGTLPDGTVHKGHMSPLLMEFSIKYGHWFSSSIEMRLIMAYGMMMAEVHRMNTEAPAVNKQANEKTASKKATDAAKKL